MTTSSAFDTSVKQLQQGGIIAYPTEGVYGLGCDPFNEIAVKHLCELKQRSIEKGLILISHSWDYIASLTKPVDLTILKKIQATWPGPCTWVFPASTKVPTWIRGLHNSIALRITNHPIARTLCKVYAKPIVSTSANPSNLPAANTIIEVQHYFGSQIDYILEGKVGNLQGPTSIWDAITGKQLR